MENSFAKTLIALGCFLVILGLIFLFASKIKIPFLGKLPGDILIKKDNFIFFFPLTTCLLISVLLTLLFLLLRR